MNARLLSRITLLLGAAHAICVITTAGSAIIGVHRLVDPMLMITFITLIPAAPLFHAYFHVLRREAKRLALIQPPSSARSA